ncbi:MAG: hypothetical protein ACLGH3_10150 [Actinomycetota bacterium]
MGQVEKLNPARRSLAGFLLLLAVACSPQPVAAPTTDQGQPEPSATSSNIDQGRQAPATPAQPSQPEGTKPVRMQTPADPGSEGGIDAGKARSSKLVITVEPGCGRPGDRLRASTETVPTADIAWGVEYPDGSNHGEYGIAKADAGGKATWIIQVGSTAPTGPAQLMVAANKTAETYGDPRYQASGKVSFEISLSC